MKYTFNQVKELVSNIDWSAFGTLTVDGRKIRSVELRKDDMWLLILENDGYHVAEMWSSMSDEKKEIVVNYLKTIQKHV